MTNSIQPLPPRPKRSKRFRLFVLLAAFCLLLVIGFPLRVYYANRLLRQSLLAYNAADTQFALKLGADPNLALRRPTNFDLASLFFPRKPRPGAGNARTALMFAAGSRQAPIVNLLLKYGADVNSRLTDGGSALLYATSSQNSAQVPPGGPVLMRASSSQTVPQAYTQVLEALLAGGADIHVQDRAGMTPLLFAAQTGQTSAVRLLLAKGADIHETDYRQQTALTFAVENCHEETIQFLLTQGADERDLKAARLLASTPYVQFLTAAPDPTWMPQAQATLPTLVFAAKYGSLTLVKFLLARIDLNAKPQISPITGYTPLHYAVGLPNPNYSLQMSALLIAHGADVNAEDRAGATPWLTVGSSNLETMRLLLAHGANARAIERRSGQNALMRGLRNLDMARLLVQLGLNVNALDRNGRTALMQCKSPQVAAFLVEQGADINVQDKAGRTALMECRFPQTAALLIKRGADVNAHDKTGKTALMECSSPKIAALLITRGANVNACDNQGNTPLLLATKSLDSWPGKVAYLLKAGANIHVLNSQGETPLSNARLSGSDEVRTLLTEAGAN